jgi:hypothetical protein
MTTPQKNNYLSPENSPVLSGKTAHENDGKSLGELLYEQMFKPQLSWVVEASDTQRKYDLWAEAVAAEVRRRDGDRVKSLEGELEQLEKALAKGNDILDVLEAHGVVTESCDRDGNTYCDCLEKAVEQFTQVSVDGVSNRDNNKARELEAALLNAGKNWVAREGQLQAEIERLKGSAKDLSDARDNVARELWKERESNQERWDRREKEVDSMRDSLKQCADSYLLIQRENEDLKRAEKERPQRRLEEFTKAAFGPLYNERQHQFTEYDAADCVRAAKLQLAAIEKEGARE